MGTLFNEVIDLALIIVDDYKLNKYYIQNPEGFYKHCDGLLIKAIPNFTVCRQSLEYTVDYDVDPPIREFVNILSMYEKDILADYWAVEWLKRETQKASAINTRLQNSGSFRTHSEAQNLKSKESYLDGMRVKVSQKCMDYLTMDVLSVLDY